MIFLILDDNQDDVFAVKRYLRQIYPEVHVHRAVNAEEALVLVDTRQLDCLLVDLHLGAVSGLDFLTALSDARGVPPLPTIVLTGSGSEQTAVAALKAGAHDYLRKEALSAASLKRAISFSLERFRTQSAWMEQKELLRQENLRLARSTEVTMQMVAGASHELRTPLTAILGIVETFEAEHGKPMESERRDELVTALRSCSESLLLTVDDIIDLARAEAGKLVLNPVVFELKQEAEETLNALRILATSKGLTLKLRIDPELPEAFFGDARRLRQVLYNLLGNAIKFTREGEVALRISRAEKGTVRFAVHDTGVGISEQDRARIFESYYRASEGTTGSGLGLTVCRSLLMALQASPLQVESEVGEGSVFSFTVALEPRRLEASQDGQLEVAEQAERSRRLLVAEDNPLVARILSGQLRNLGHQVEVVEDGASALELLGRDGDFDAIIMDCQMPRMDGYEATRKIRQDLGLDLPIIALSAEALTAHRDKGLKAGMTDFLVKPVSVKRLQSVLLSHLASHQAASR